MPGSLRPGVSTGRAVSVGDVVSRARSQFHVILRLGGPTLHPSRRFAGPGGEMILHPRHARLAEPLEPRRLLAGELDPTFGGGDGIVMANFTGFQEEARELATTRTKA